MKRLARRILPLAMALVVPVGSVCAQDVTGTEKDVTQEVAVQQTYETQQNKKNERTIQVESEFQCMVGDTFSLGAQVDGDDEVELIYQSSDTSVVEIVEEETSEDNIIETDSKDDITEIESEEHSTGEDEKSQAEQVSDLVKVHALAEGDATVTITAPETDTYKETSVEVQIHVSADGTLTPQESDEKTEGEKKEDQNLPKPKTKSTVEGIQVTWDQFEIKDGYSYYLGHKPVGGSWSKLQKITVGSDASYLDTDVKEDTSYYYRIFRYPILESGEEKTEDDIKSKYALQLRLAAPALSVGLASSGNQLRWNRTTGASGYYVYRKATTGDNWEKVAQITQPGEVAWVDTSVGDGQTYIYTVQTYSGTSCSAYAAEKSYVRVATPSAKSWKRLSSKKYQLKWSKVSSATGYQVQYASNALFSGAKTKTISNGNTTSYKTGKLSTKKTYYARVRAYKKINGQTYYSAWSAASSVKKTRTTKATVLKKKKKVFEIRAAAGQVVGQYDTLQGSCSDGTYAYYLLYNTKTINCKLVKVQCSNMNVVAVSDSLNVGHGNDMTYDSDKNRIVIIHSTGRDPKAVTTIDPNTLQVIEAGKHITIPTKLAGGSIEDATNATSYSGIAYSGGRKQYALLLSHNYNFVLLDQNLNPIQYVKISKRNNYTVQGIDVTDDYILVAQSPKSSKQKYNIITVYDWDGNYISKINVKKGYEIESVYHVGSKYYAGFYRAYYKTYYKKVVKKVKVKGKVKKKKVKVKYRKYLRDNYVYQITGF